MKTRRRKNKGNHKSILWGIIITLFFTFINSYAQQDVPPECKNLSKVRKMIVYPDSAKDNGIEGRVTIKLLVDLDGSVAKSGVITGPEVFYNEIRRVCMFLLFNPAIHNGEKVKCWVLVPFNFKLRNDEEDEK